ncbi:MAG: Mut7-C RNAse domain-containing protein [Candidatus Omnitrophota bacterium]
MKFIATKELGRLVKWMRIAGFDTEYFKEDNHSKLKITALRESRVILTRNTKLSKPRGIKSVQIKSELLNDQMREVFKELKIKPDKDSMFSRCTICNAELVSVEKNKIKHKVPEYVFETQEEFVVCPTCQRVYWQGTHWGNVQDTLKEI